MSEKEKDFGTEQTPATQEKSAKQKPAKKEKKKSNGIARWFREMRAELKKVTWPTHRQTLNNTLVVIVCCVFIGVFIWVFDWLAAALIGALLSFKGA